MQRSHLISTADILQVAQIVACTEAEGPGRRFAVWLQGCPLRCPGCCNPEMLPFAGGVATPMKEVIQRVERAREKHGVEGVTLLGGEPFAHAAGAARLAVWVQNASLSVMVFSGYRLEELQAASDPAVSRLLDHTDILVDGPYLREHPEAHRRWIGSTNQRIHFLSDRYTADDPCWRLPNTLEIRLQGNQVMVNGFPTPSAVAFWRRHPPNTSQPQGGT